MVHGIVHGCVTIQLCYLCPCLLAKPVAGVEAAACLMFLFHCSLYLSRVSSRLCLLHQLELLDSMWCTSYCCRSECAFRKLIHHSNYYHCSVASGFLSADGEWSCFHPRTTEQCLSYSCSLYSAHFEYHLDCSDCCPGCWRSPGVVKVACCCWSLPHGHLHARKSRKCGDPARFLVQCHFACVHALYCQQDRHWSSTFC